MRGSQNPEAAGSRPTILEPKALGSTISESTAMAPSDLGIDDLGVSDLFDQQAWINDPGDNRLGSIGLGPTILSDVLGVASLGAAGFGLAVLGAKTLRPTILGSRFLRPAGFGRRLRSTTAIRAQRAWASGCGVLRQWERRGLGTNRLSQRLGSCSLRIVTRKIGGLGPPIFVSLNYLLKGFTSEINRWRQRSNLRDVA